MKTQLSETASFSDIKASNFNNGFTLIELIIVMVLLGVLAATALPRYIDVTGRAHESTLNAVGSAYSASIALSHAQWMASGYAPGADVDDLIGYGDSNLNMSVLGWPVGVVGETNNPDLTVQGCIDLWVALLQTGAPNISDSSPKADFLVTLGNDAKGGKDCIYTYQPDNKNNTIRYDADHGIVVTSIN